MEQVILTLDDGYESLDRYLRGPSVSAARDGAAPEGYGDGDAGVSCGDEDPGMPGGGDGKLDDVSFGLYDGADTEMAGSRSTPSTPRRILLVCGRSFSHLQISHYLAEAEERLDIRLIPFDDFQPNPHYESVVKGVELFRKEDCEAILAVGGGSAIDVAKCIKLYACMDPSKSYLEQKIVPNGIPLMAVPTTAGTGSEATRFAVIYHHGEKQSVTDASCIPSVVFFDPTVLETLPLYQKKAAMLDALCHGIESFWSIHSTEESKAYAREAIRLILAHMDEYLAEGKMGETRSSYGARSPRDPEREQVRPRLADAYPGLLSTDRGNVDRMSVNTAMFRAADLAGRAINITQTTAGHAMSYKLTSLYKIAHGHAAALCVACLWPYMLAHMEDCIDPRGKGYLQGMFEELAEVFGAEADDTDLDKAGDTETDGRDKGTEIDVLEEGAQRSVVEKAMQQKITMQNAAAQFAQLLRSLELDVPVAAAGDIGLLCRSVNPDRLKNNPIKLDEKTLRNIYRQILR